jgi:hypothetical protein
MKFRHLLAAASLLSLCAQPVLAADKKVEKGPSRYLRCDGQPNNTTAGESAARLLGALTLLSIFAPSPEAPDASARKFGEEGVKACSSLIDGVEDIEGNPIRRLELILARAIHQIEAKNYEAAIADIRLAKSEADAKGFSMDVYFDRSMGLSFDLIEAEALLRMDKYDEARAVSLAKLAKYPHSYYPIMAARSYATYNRTISTEERARMTGAPKVLVTEIYPTIGRLEEVGEFSKAAEGRETWLEFVDLLNNEDKYSLPHALAAMTHGLAGNWEKADVRAKFAADNIEARSLAGKPDTTEASTREVLDFYKLLKLADKGGVKDARRNFAARSDWPSIGFGAKMEANRRLRKDALPEELTGLLALTPDQMWAERIERTKAAMLERDKNNKTLFTYILPLAKAESYESLSKSVWRTEKSRIMAAEPSAKTKDWSMSIYGDATTQPDALLLHAALQAKARGSKTFNFIILADAPSSASARFAVGDTEKVVDGLALDTEAVIAELRQIIPPPEEVLLRKAEREKQKKVKK